MTVRNFTNRGWLALIAVWLVALAFAVAGLRWVEFSYVTFVLIAVLLSASWWPWFQKSSTRNLPPGGPDE